MQSHRILLVDTTLHQAPWPLFMRALEELSKDHAGLSFAFVDEAQFLLPHSFKNRVLTRLLDYINLKAANPATRRRAADFAARSFGYRRHPLHREALNLAVLAAAKWFHPDIVLVVMGFHMAPATLQALKREGAGAIVNYSTDDPFNARLSTAELRASIPLYDIYACTKKGIMEDVRRSGCGCVHYVPFAYEPSMHFPEQPACAEEHRRFDSDVAFIGEADADRVPFLRTLAEQMPQLDLALYGGMWDRHPATRRYARGAVRGRDFRLALGGTRISINLIRRGNRDDHVMRSYEAPACGAFTLNERTPEHLALFGEDREAAFFGSAQELVDKVQYYLAHDAERAQIAAAGHKRVISTGNTYRDRMVQILGLCEDFVRTGSNQSMREPDRDALVSQAV